MESATRCPDRRSSRAAKAGNRIAPSKFPVHGRQVSASLSFPARVELVNWPQQSFLQPGGGELWRKTQSSRFRHRNLANPARIELGGAQEGTTETHSLPRGLAPCPPASSSDWHVAGGRWPSTSSSYHVPSSHRFVALFNLGTRQLLLFTDDDRHRPWSRTFSEDESSVQLQQFEGSRLITPHSHLLLILLQVWGKQKSSFTDSFIIITRGPLIEWEDK